jgi:hypothetical protein
LRLVTSPFGTLLALSRDSHHQNRFVGLAETNGIFGPSGSPFGQGGFNGGKPLMGPGFPFTGGESIGWGSPAVNTGAGMTGPGGEHVGGYKTKGY